MLRVYNLSVHRSLIEKLEITITVFLLVLFLGKFQLPVINSLIKILSYPLIAVLVALHWRRISWIAIKDIPLLLLWGFSLASVFWSVTPGISLATNRGLFRIFLFGAYLAARYSIKEQMKIYAWVFSIAMILGLVVALAIPGYGFSHELRHDGAFTGLFDYKNSTGYSLVIGAMTFLVFAIKDRKPNWLAWSLFCLAVILTIFTKSSASLVCLLTVLLPIPLYQLIKLHYKTKVLILCLVLILVGIVVGIILGNLETILVDILDEGIELNGRTPLWSAIIEKLVEERPWLGYGTSAFWKSDAGLFVIMTSWASEDRENMFSQSFNFHSSYISILANLGFVGFFLYVMSLVTVSIRVIILLISTKRIEFFWCFQFIIYIVVGGFGDQLVSIIDTNSYCIIYVSVCFSTLIEWRRIKIENLKYKYN